MLTFIQKPFSELTAFEFHEIIALREQVFVVEQNCPYQDVDGKDIMGIHVMGFWDGELVATSRLLPLGISYDKYVSIGRVCVHQKIRRTNAGIQLMEFSMQEIKRQFPGHSIKISAQSYLLKFYSKFGFEAVGDTYLEDDIPHQAMIYKI
jgi:ElaA protein